MSWTANRWSRSRPTPSFSLDEAARIRRMIAQGEEWPTCPDCHQPLERRVGRDDDTAIWVVRCHVCGRGIVMTIAGERPENHPANAS